MNEEERISALASLFAVADARAPQVGIGDDAAVIQGVSESLVWTVDASVEGTHFNRAWLSFEDIGYRSMMAAVSDLAAMGAAPLGVLSALALPPSVSDADLLDLARGQRLAADASNTAVIGGNLARANEFSITTTALGRAPSPVLRSGARPGDRIWLFGPVGLAAAGLRFLQDQGARIAALRTQSASGRGDSLCTPDALSDADVIERCIHAWKRPRARTETGLAMRAFATAAVDVSDGLARDLGHLVRASGVCGALSAAHFRRGGMGEASEASEATAASSVGLVARAAALLGVDALSLMLFGGEDYALVVTAPPDVDASNIGGVHIGDIEALSDIEAPPVLSGAAPAASDVYALQSVHAPSPPNAEPPRTRLFLVDENGGRAPLAERGFDHFASATG